MMESAIQHVPKDADYRQLQIECKQIGEPFIKLLCDIYNVSKFSLILSPSQPNIPPSIIYAEEHEAERVRLHMKLAIDIHIAEFNKRFGIEPPK